MRIYKAVKMIERLLMKCFNAVITIRYTVKILDIEKNKKLERSADSCFIVLPGLSLNDFDLAQVNGYDVITTNYFYASDDFKKINSRYHLVMDRKFFANEENYAELDSLVDLGVNVIVNSRFYTGDNPSVVKIFPLYRALPDRLLFNIGGVCTAFHTVALFAVNMAIDLGYKNINLVGFDLPPGYLPHAYAPSACQLKEIDQEKSKQGEWDYCELFWQYTNCHHEAYWLERKAQSKGVQIINHSKSSYVKAFRMAT